MEQQEINAIKMDMLEQAKIAMKEAVETQNAAMVAAIAALVRSLDV